MRAGIGRRTDPRNTLPVGDPALEEARLATIEEMFRGSNLDEGAAAPAPQAAIPALAAAPSPIEDVNQEKFKYTRSREKLIAQLKVDFPESVENDVVDSNRLIIAVMELLRTSGAPPEETERKIELILESFFTMGLLKNKDAHKLLSESIKVNESNLLNYKILRPVLRYYSLSDYELQDGNILHDSVLQLYAGEVIKKNEDPNYIEILINFCKKQRISLPKIIGDIPDDGQSDSNLLIFCIQKFRTNDAILEKTFKTAQLLIENSDADTLDKQDKKGFSALTMAGFILEHSLNKGTPKPELMCYAIRIIGALLIHEASIDNSEEKVPRIAKVLKGVKTTIDSYKIKTSKEFCERVAVSVDKKGFIQLAVKPVIKPVVNKVKKLIENSVEPLPEKFENQNVSNYLKARYSENVVKWMSAQIIRADIKGADTAFARFEESIGLIRKALRGKEDVAKIVTDKYADFPDHPAPEMVLVDLEMIKIRKLLNEKKSAAKIKEGLEGKDPDKYFQGQIKKSVKKEIRDHRHDLPAQQTSSGAKKKGIKGAKKKPAFDYKEFATKLPVDLSHLALLDHGFLTDHESRIRLIALKAILSRPEFHADKFDGGDILQTIRRIKSTGRGDELSENEQAAIAAVTNLNPEDSTTIFAKTVALKECGINHLPAEYLRKALVRMTKETPHHLRLAFEYIDVGSFTEAHELLNMLIEKITESSQKYQENPTLELRNRILHLQIGLESMLDNRHVDGNIFLQCIIKAGEMDQFLDVLGYNEDPSVNNIIVESFIATLSDIEYKSKTITERNDNIELILSALESFIEYCQRNKITPLKGFIVPDLNGLHLIDPRITSILISHGVIIEETEDRNTISLDVQNTVSRILTEAFLKQRFNQLKRELVGDDVVSQFDEAKYEAFANQFVKATEEERNKESNPVNKIKKLIEHFTDVSEGNFTDKFSQIDMDSDEFVTFFLLLQKGQDLGKIGTNLSFLMMKNLDQKDYNENSIENWLRNKDLIIKLISKHCVLRNENLCIQYKNTLEQKDSHYVTHTLEQKDPHYATHAFPLINKKHGSVELFEEWINFTQKALGSKGINEDSDIFSAIVDSLSKDPGRKKLESIHIALYIARNIDQFKPVFSGFFVADESSKLPHASNDILTKFCELLLPTIQELKEQNLSKYVAKLDPASLNAQLSFFNQALDSLVIFTAEIIKLEHLEGKLPEEFTTLKGIVIELHSTRESKIFELVDHIPTAYYEVSSKDNDIKNTIATLFRNIREISKRNGYAEEQIKKKEKELLDKIHAVRPSLPKIFTQSAIDEFEGKKPAVEVVEPPRVERVATGVGAADAVAGADAAGPNIANDLDGFTESEDEEEINLQAFAEKLEAGEQITLKEFKDSAITAIENVDSDYISLLDNYCEKHEGFLTAWNEDNSLLRDLESKDKGILAKLFGGNLKVNKNDEGLSLLNICSKVLFEIAPDELGYNDSLAELLKIISIIAKNSQGNIDERNEDGFTSLHEIAFTLTRINTKNSGNKFLPRTCLKAIAILLENGADVDKVNPQNKTDLNSKISVETIRLIKELFNQHGTNLSDELLDAAIRSINDYAELEIARADLAAKEAENVRLEKEVRDGKIRTLINEIEKNSQKIPVAIDKLSAEIEKEKEAKKRAEIIKQGVEKLTKDIETRQKRRAFGEWRSAIKENYQKLTLDELITKSATSKLAKETLMTRFVQLGNDLQERSDQIDDLKGQIGENAKGNAKAEEDNFRKFTEMSSKISDLERQVKAKQLSLERKEKGHQEALSKKDDAKRKAVAAAKEDNGKLRKRLEAAQKDAEALKRDKIKAEKAAKELQIRFDALKSAQDGAATAAAAEVEAAGLKAQITALEAQVSGKDVQIAELGTKAAEQDVQVAELEAQVSGKDVQIAELGTKAAEQDARVTALSKQASDRDTRINELEAQVDTEVEQKTSLETICANMGNEITRLQMQVTNYEAALRESLEKQHAKLTEEFRAFIEIKDAEVGESYARLQGEIGRIQAEKYALNKALIAAQAAQEEAEASARLARGLTQHKENEKIAEDLAKARQEAADARREVGNARADAVAARKALESATSGTSKLHAQIYRLNSENYALRGQNVTAGYRHPAAGGYAAGGAYAMPQQQHDPHSAGAAPSTNPDTRHRGRKGKAAAAKPLAGDLSNKSQRNFD